MNDNLNKNIFKNYNKETLTSYYKLFIMRLTHSNMSIEKDLGNVDDSKNAIRLRDNMKAFLYLEEELCKNSNITEDIITEVASLINESSQYISTDYRKTGNKLGETNIPISEPSKIKSDMEKLLFLYHNDWKQLDPFEREALFNIEFLRIHPFEDGNGRTSRLILNYNLLKQGIAPVIITEEMTDYYFALRNNSDVISMKQFFEEQSKKEKEIVKFLYNEINDKLENKCSKKI